MVPPVDIDELLLLSLSFTTTFNSQAIKSFRNKMTKCLLCVIGAIDPTVFPPLIVAGAQTVTRYIGGRGTREHF